MIPKQEIAEIRALCELATPAPWEYYGYGVLILAGNMRIADIRGWGHLTGKGTGGLGLSDDEAIAVQTANGELIAKARELMPRLLGALEAETKRANDHEKVLDSLHDPSCEIDDDKVLIYVPESKVIEMQAEELKGVTADRDYWKAKAEALENAMRGTCKYCINVEGERLSCSIYCTGEGWRFDQYRFMGKEDKNA